MRVSKVSVLLSTVMLFAAISVQASERKSKCFRIEENKGTGAPSSEILCLTSSNLKLFPKSVVTVTLMRDEHSTRPRLLAKRHYFKVAKNEYGRKLGAGKPMVVFNEDQQTVYLGFTGAEGKTYHFQPVDDITIIGRVPSQTRQADILGTR